MQEKKRAQFTTAQSNPDINTVKDIAAEELVKKLTEVHLIDVRRPDEFTGELGHVPGAKLIVLDTLPEYIASIPVDETIVFICRSGGRSARATAFALANGLSDVYNMAGGMLRWNELGLKTEGANGKVG